MLKKIVLLLALSLVLAVPVFAKEAPERTVVQVNGSSEKEVVPDMARFSASVTTLNANLEQAKNTNTETMNKVLASLQEQGITDKEIKTDTYRVEPIYNYDKDKLPSLKGYRVINRIEITTAVEKVGLLVNEVTNAGANEVSSIRFENKNEKEIKNDALQDAVKDAMKKAEVIAGALNKKIANVKLVNESGVFYRPVMLENRFMKTAAVDGAVPNISAGNVTVGANVQVTVELAD